ncbi:MAG: hypothetical protein KatS3mg038_0379 [Candidatus Kapaibacterium sp.]|nr:MAG: hypothetical protein KatS3mg038_0379 [Candidatus Kapabacteria bacterium]
MFTVFEIRGDNLCCGSCELPAGNRAFFFRSGLMCWLFHVPDGAVQPATPRHVVALVSRAPEIEPYVVVSSWVLRKRADRQFRRHGRRRATVRCVRTRAADTCTPTPASMLAWVARRYRVPVLRASLHAPIVVGDSWVRIGRGNDYIVLGHDHATHETADGERRLSYRRNAAEIAELVGHKLRAWL